MSAMKKIGSIDDFINEQLNESIPENVTIIDWDEWMKPDYVILQLSNGKKLKIDKQHVKGGKAAYHKLTTLLDNLHDPRAQKILTDMVNQMLINT